MSSPRRLVIPLRGFVLPGLGIPILEPNRPVFVRTVQAYVAVALRLDTGAHITEIGVDWARAYGIPITGSRVTFPVATGAGSITCSGWLGTVRVRLPGWSPTEFTWSCFFRERRPLQLPPQLSLASVLPDLRLHLDGEPAHGAPSGILLVEERVAPSVSGPAP